MGTAGLLTLLFTDIVGSTPLHSRLGDVAADARIERHLGGVTAVVGEHGGTVVKTLGDGVLATFRSARDALACATALQEAEAAHPDPLGMRVGLAAGDVIERDDDVHGLVVAAASRIAGLATAGEIVVADLVRQLAGPDPSLRFVDRGLVELRGIPDAVRVAVLDWDGTAAKPTPGPATVPATGVQSAVVGREPELAALRAAVDDTLTGRGRVVLLGGEPGIGKTTLATAAAEHAAERGALVAWGACWEGEGAPAFWPWVQALRATAEAIEAAGIAAGLGERQSELARLMPELGGAAEPAEPLSNHGTGADARFRLFDSLAAYLAELSQARPVVVVLDDLHWADQSSIDLLRFVARTPRSGRLLVVGTYRDSEVGEGHPLWPVLGDVDRSGSRLAVEGLDAASTGELLAALGAPVERAASVHQHTRGNPFFVRELSRLPEGGGLPPGVRAVLGQRLARLSAGAIRAVRLVAVAGELELDVLEAAVGSSRVQLLAPVDEAVAAGVLAPIGPADRLRFVHALFRDAVLAGLPSADRGALHGVVAAAMESTRPDRAAAELAHHHREAARAGGDRPTAARWCATAGREAMAALAFGEAADLFAAAVDLVGSADPPARGELLLALGDAQRFGGELERAKATFFAVADLARSLGDPDLLARAALASCQRGGPVGLFFSFGDPGSRALLEEALTTVPPGDSPLRARLLAALAVELSYPTPEDDGPLLRAIEECLAIAERVGDGGARLQAALVMLARRPQREVGGVDWYAEALALAREAGDPALDVGLTVIGAVLALEEGEVARADIELRRAEAMAERLGIPSFKIVADLMRGIRTHMEGDLEEASRVADEVIEAVRASGNRFALSQWGAQAFALRRDLGEVPDPRRVQRYAETFPMPTSWSALAWSLAEHGRLQEAGAQLLHAAGGAHRRQPPDDHNRAVWWFQSGHVAAAVGDRDTASWLYDIGLVFEGRFVRAGYGAIYGAADHVLGLLAQCLERHEDAERHLHAAVARNDFLPSRPWAARSRLALARLLGSTDRAEEGHQLATAALAAAEAMGMRGVAAESEALCAELAAGAADPVVDQQASPSAATSPSRAPAIGRFRREGNVWAVAHAGTEARVLDSKGMADIAVLLARPRVEVHVAELVGVSEELGGPLSKQAALDDTAIRAYRARLQELAEEEDDAEVTGDARRSERARAEREAITDQLAADLGLGGGSRSTPDWVERARKSVRRRIDAALKRIEAENPDAGRHLRRSIRTGVFCVYDPIEPTDWEP